MMDKKEALQVIEENLAVDYGNLDHEQTKRLDEAIDMAIGALRAQADGDTISRQAAIDAVKFGITYAKAINKSTGEIKELFKEGNKALNEAVERLKELPSAQPEQRWIPVDLRNNSPEENKVVLLGVRFQDDFKYFVTSRQDYNYWTGLGREIKGELRWQPLPEQYRAERRTDERQT